MDPSCDGQESPLFECLIELPDQLDKRIFYNLSSFFRGAFYGGWRTHPDFRTLRGMTQKYLGLMLGFPDNSADVRLAQNESEDRTPKTDLTAQLAEALDVSPKAIAVPDIGAMDGLMHTHFALEDRN